MRTYRLHFLDDRNVGRFDFQADADYRFFLLNDHIVGQLDFQAEGDDRAVEIAEIMFDPCADRCRSWQIWDGDVFLVSGPQKIHRGRSQVSDLAERIQENVVEFEETILRSAWAIASSERLLAELDKLKASKRDASRYSLS
jgi:hypothetical protein